jgi:hypothetical protein
MAVLEAFLEDPVAMATARVLHHAMQDSGTHSALHALLVIQKT